MDKILRRLLMVLGVVVGLLLSAVLVLVLLSILTGGISPSECWDIPAGYKGWVVVRYGNTQCGSGLLTRGLFHCHVIAIPQSGRACTGFAMPAGWYSSHYDYVSPDGRRTRAEVHALYTSPDTNELVAFVGTDAERKARLQERPRVGRSAPD